MSSDNEDCDLDYGIDDGFGKAFDSGRIERSEKEGNIEYLDEEDECPVDSPEPRFTKTAKKSKAPEDDGGDEQCGLEDLLNLIENEDEQPPSEEESTKKEKPPAKKNELREDDSFVSSLNTSADKRKSSITITKINKTKEESGSSGGGAVDYITEKYTGARLVKSTFKNQQELHTRLSCDYGKFYKLIDLKRYSTELKDNKDPNFLWFSIFVLSGKTETKSSAKGNNYVIWRISDINAIDRDHDISLFLFGNAYKTHWKASEFEVFALCKPEFLADNKNDQQQSGGGGGGGGSGGGGNTYFNSANHSLGKKPVLSTNWNKFASKKVANNLQIKFAMSIKAEYQLIPLGHSKDITTCQSFKQNVSMKAEYVGEAAKRCKNLVNLQQVPYCVYHCKQLDKSKNQDGFGKYSMANPTGNRSAALTTRFGSEGLFPATAPDVQFASLYAGANSLKKQMEQKEDRLKALKEIKAERLLSLNSSISQDSGLLSTVAFKTNKRSDKELMASLDGKQLSAEEIREIRLAEQATIRHVNQIDNSEQKELSKIFNCKALITSEKTCFTSVSSQKLVELKKSHNEALNSVANSLGSSDYTNTIRQKYEEKKNNFGLSGLASHRDILKKVKEDKKLEKANGKEPEVKPKETKSGNFFENTNKSIVASDFLKEIVAPKKPVPAKPEIKKAKEDDFDLELYDGDSVISKKLNDSPSLANKPASQAPMNAYRLKIKEMLDRSSKEKSLPKLCDTTNSKVASPTASPARALQGVKRQASPSVASESPDERRAKKLKAIDEILNIKSNHAKEANDIDKNPHIKAYFDRLETQEKIDDKLSSTTRREVNAVTCPICSYTSFSQSEYCRNQKHQVKRHMAIQRYFKCKRCNNRTYTLDKICPTTGCAQCGFESFEPCGMKSALCDPVQRSTQLDLDSELLAAN